MSFAFDKDYPRRIVLDDTHPRIQYSGTDDWSLDTGSFDNNGQYGPPMNRTMHGAKKQGASFKIDFEGDYILVRGAQDPSIPTNQTSPTWSCFIDGDPIPAFPFTNPNRTTHNTLCELGHMSWRPHTLTVNTTSNMPFWLDYIEYHPRPELEGGVAGELLRIDSSDSSVQYNNASSQWEDLGFGLNATGKTGGNVKVKFNGTSISLYTFLEGSEVPWSASPARYHIDNEPDVQFTIPASKTITLNGTNTTSDVFNQLLFNASSLSLDREHEVSVTFDGLFDERKPPVQWLVVDYFLVTASSSSPESSEAASKRPAILAISVGAVLGLLALGLGFWFFAKRWRRNRKEGDGSWFSGAEMMRGMGGGHNYAAVTPFIPAEDGRALNPVAPWETATPTSRTGIAYPPEKQGYRYSNASSSSMHPLLSPSASSSSTPGSQSFQSQSLASSSPPPSTLYLDPSSQEAAVRKHRDSGIRIPTGSTRVEELPPDYTLH
ncbi:hypothetical protein V5O48_014870 [Marasmius crinis-equi]|uniref:Uncharacterized protein n=1 Tax=Marasmius crinis-equi TaxID=585013 RepID=A0ABR3EW61_9AGAR